MDGTTGEVIAGALDRQAVAEVLQAIIEGNAAARTRGRSSASTSCSAWADEERRLQRARQRRHARTTRAWRAPSAPQGIGLCRTEHMFFDEDRIALGAAHDPRRRRRGSGSEALGQLLPMQQRRLRGHPRGDGRPAGDDPPARPAAARVPAARAARRSQQLAEQMGVEPATRCAARCEALAEVEPDARPPRLPARAHRARHLRHAGRRRSPAPPARCSSAPATT